MKFKTSAIALAVAGAVAAPMAAQADLYASVRVGVENVDTGGVSDLRMRSYGSRFGVKSETDLGNGMTGFGKFEWDVDFKDHNEDVNSVATAGGDKDDVDNRHRYVGLKGDAGSLTIGQTYHTFYNHVVGPNDNPWWGSGYSMVKYTGRTDGAVTFAGSTGAVSYGVTGYFLREAEEDKPDALEVGASFGVGDMTLGVAMATTETAQGSTGTDDDVLGLALSGIGLGDASMGVGFMSQDDDTSLLVDVGIGNIYIHYETLDMDASDRTTSLINVGYTQSLGRNTTAWYEALTYDADATSDDDMTVIRGVLKYNIE